MSTTKRSTDKDDSTSPTKDADKVPSGFVLKLFQMVNGAPDEIISWLPSGDAFRISDLERLENETLPTFFRHRRFQSLVRQLNFYNFRKVNRERTFWVYRHNLFHRDRPEELYLLRRRTCPGVDGRKHRPDMDIQSLEAGVRSNSPMRINEDLSDADSVLSSTVATAAANGRRAQKHRKAKGGNNVIPEDLNDSTSMAGVGVGVGGATNRVKRGLNLIKSAEVSDVESASLSHYQSLTGKPSVDSSLLDTEEADKRSRVSVSSGDEDDEAYESKKRRLERSEQALLVNKVARQLDEHARRAGQKSVKRRVGTVTPPFSNDTMKYHALTYDDEIEIFRSEDISNGGCEMSKRTQGHIIVTDGDDSEDDDEYYAKHVEPATLLGVQSMNGPTKENEERFTSPPVSDMLIIADIAYKFRNGVGSEPYLQTNKEECHLAAAVAQFCMSTAPQDPMLGKKALQLMMGCDRLAQEFRLYKAALSPNSTPPSILSIKGKSQSVVKQFFGKDTDKEAVRVFKAFVLNCLDDLVGGSNLAKAAQLTKSESHCLNHCVKTWFAGVVASS